jgi:hypothetical protein
MAKGTEKVWTYNKVNFWLFTKSNLSVRLSAIHIEGASLPLSECRWMTGVLISGRGQFGNGTRADFSTAPVDPFPQVARIGPRPIASDFIGAQEEK